MMGWLGKRTISAEEFASAIKGAVTDATTAATLAAHIDQCIRDKAETKAALRQQDAERQQMHQENQKKFAEITKQNTSIMRIVWAAAGAASVISFLASGSGGKLIALLRG